MRRPGLRFLSRLALLTGLLRPTEAAAQTAHPGPRTPPAWTAYAEQLQAVLPTWFVEGQSEAAQRLRAYVASASDPALPLAPVVVRLWVDAQGVVSRIEVSEGLPAEAAAALRASVLQRRLPPPPARLPMPIRMRLSFPSPDPPAGAP